MAAQTSIPGFADACVASVTSPSEEVGNPVVVAAPVVLTVTVAASSSVLTVAVAAYMTAPVVLGALHLLHWWHGLCVRMFVGASGEGGRGYLTFSFLEELEQGGLFPVGGVGSKSC